MTNLNTIIELANLCRKRNIEMSINKSQIVLSAYRNGRVLSKSYEFELLGKIVKDLPIEIILDLFIEETVLQFKRAVC